MIPTPPPRYVGVVCASVAAGLGCRVPQASVGTLLSGPGGAQGWAPSCCVPARLRERGSGRAMALGTMRGRWGKPRPFGSAKRTMTLPHAVITSGAVPSLKGESCAWGPHPEERDIGVWEAQIEPRCLSCTGRRSENEET